MQTLRPDTTTPAGTLLRDLNAALRGLKHPTLLPLLNIRQEGELYAFVYADADASALVDLPRKRRQHVEFALRCGLEIADALAWAQGRGQIHARLSPRQILANESGQFWLAGFGIARLAAPVDAELPYVAPEILHGNAPAAQSDLWSLGVILFEMLTGRLPFGDGASVQESITQHATPDIQQHRSDLPSALVDMIYRLLTKDPEQRVPSARHLGAALEDILFGRAPLASGRRFGQSHTRQERPLPTHGDTLAGREEELAHIATHLREGHTRLLTILAPGGMGKTRLAIESARLHSALRYSEAQHQAAFRDGVCFVELAPLSDASTLPAALADALGFRPRPGPHSAYQQLLDYLSQQTMLIVLDNFEHLLEGAEFVGRILEAAPGLRLLITSRERLGLSEESILHLGGLPVADWPDVEQALQAPAVQLFLMQARRTRPDFRLNTENLPAIRQICHQVQGMPLALMLAAGWLGVLHPQEIAGELANNPDILETDLRDWPERHRSIRRVFEQTWNLLRLDEQNAMQRLSVFRGTFTLEAAQAVTGVSVRTLHSLTHKALLWRHADTGRFEMHELLRHYASLELVAAAEDGPTRDKHSAYYAGMLNLHTPLLLGEAGASRDVMPIQAALTAHFATSRAEHFQLNILLDPLTERELEILRQVADGLSNHDIARTLAISVSTVKTHLYRIYDKLQVNSRTQAILQAQALRLLP